MNQREKAISIVLVAFIAILWISSIALAQNDPCLAPDNGGGTVDLPANCPYIAPFGPMYIIDGLPSGTTIELQPIHRDFICTDPPLCSTPLPPGDCEAPGGSMAGYFECFESTLELTVTGTGGLTGFNRYLAVPMMSEVHTGPRNPGDPVQVFAADWYRLYGELFGDPDFCIFRITAGTDFGLPSPGQATLTDLGDGTFNVDSFFDVTYRIEFMGCPGSILEGFSGTTIATVRWQQGEPASAAGACCLPNGSCLITTEANCLSLDGEYFDDDTECLGDDDGDGYDDLCYEPGTCLAPDNGTGTVDLPADCPYYGPYKPMVIINGFPPGTTIELDAIFMDFLCTDPTLCSGDLDPGDCEDVGGSLGGHFQCFEATLDLTVRGTGSLEGFNRHLAVPISCEIHTGPRNPGDPVQSFPTDMYRLQGELFGDPDFCTFRIRGGTDYGLPSPGEMTLTDVGGGLYNIDSFFDVMYQIEFEGCPGSQLDGYSGTTTATIYIQQGPPPPTGACCLSDGSCIETIEIGCIGIGTYQGDWTVCLGDGNGDGVDDACPVPPSCIAPDNGSGTVDLPADCPYLPVDEVMLIIDGLPPVTTIELDPILLDFFCDGGTSCSLPIPGESCEGEGGSLGGHYHCFESTLDLTVTGTGDLAGFNRHLAVPINCEVHTGPRVSGDPVQTFPSVIFRFEGELFGDPDFCTFRIRAGEDNELPSPGYTTLTELPGGDFNVDSFFDIMYQIEFEGCPGSQLDGYSGTTEATIRLKQGSGEAETPPVGACCRLDGTCALTTETYCGDIGGEYDGDGTECWGDGDDDGYDDLCYPQGTCHAPDNGTGTVDLPADCPYYGPYEPMVIINGFPPGTTVELDAIFMDFICSNPVLCSESLDPNDCEDVGGSLGGHFECFEATLDLTVRGTGSLEGFNRHLAVPISCEIHTGPRNPGDPVQSFEADMYKLQGELFGDPDFCTFRITGGTDFGLPSPGEMTLTELGNGLYNIDSFFDVMYQIEFAGCPGSQLDGYSGTTTATIYIQQGPPPPTGACCLSDGSCIETTEIGCIGIGTYQGDWTVCLGDGNGDGVDDACPVPPSCIAPDNGSGTVDLPADCPYLPVDEVMLIIDGLPPVTTIELDPILLDFFCDGGTSCSLPIPGESCEGEGGSLGGHYHCFESTLDLTVTGTGDLAGFNRHLAVPINCEVHTGPRVPGDPVQTFPSVMFSFEGELFGDPDFCTFRIRAGEDNELPSPGYTTLTELPGGDFNVDSFFDIMYQIEFEGCPGSQLDGYSGTTEATIRLKQGSGEAETPPVGYAYFPGDVNMALGLWPPSVIGGDVTYLVGYFIGGGQASCLLDDFWASADINGDCLIIGGDVTALVGYFVAGGSLVPCPDYEPVWPPLPDEAPDGWPNCDIPLINSRIISTDSVK